MKFDDIEILDDFSDSSTNSNENATPSMVQSTQPSYNPMPSYNSISEQQGVGSNFGNEFATQQAIPNQDINNVQSEMSNESSNEFEKMVTESNIPEPVQEISPIQPKYNNNSGNNFDYTNDYANYQKSDFNNVAYNNDSNNDLVQTNVNDTNNDLIQSDINNDINNDDDLTITAVYPNGFVVPDQEEPEDNRVVKPKKSSIDLFLIIIVAILAVSLVAMLVVFYL